MSIVAELVKYPLPAFLEGRCTPATYSRWLEKKAENLFVRDRKRGKPYAATVTGAVYKEKIHHAVVNCGECDPYTGEPLAWELIGTWDTSHKQPDGYEKNFALLPTVDHITGDVLEFEICSYKINNAKNNLSPDEFVELCKKVVKFRAT